MFTVISWCTESYKHLADGLKADCQRLDYPFFLYEVEQEYLSLIRAWCNHPKIIKRGVEDFGTVLFLDVECRIVRPIPESWRAPLVSVRNPPQDFWIKYNTGTVMADVACLPWLDAWIHTIEAWDMANLPEDAFVKWPNDICDELAFSAAVTALRVELNTPQLEYLDRNSKAEIVRGLWENEYTIIQHPTIHHWLKEEDAIECKKLFVQNYAGDAKEIERLFSSQRGMLERDGWLFDLTNRTYAPRDYWERHKRDWVNEQVSLSAGQR
jgi:hypothetical protein